jgi:hypothetical protein
MTVMATDEVAQLHEEVRALTARVRSLQNLLLAAFDVDDEDRYPRAAATTNWHDVEDWVVNIMQDTLERRASNTRRWCPEWYEHPEVLTRFRILHDSYREVEKLDAYTYSNWFVDHLDRHLDAIFSPDGPFAACSPERHSPHRGLKIKRNKNAETDWGPRPAKAHEAKNGTNNGKKNTHINRPQTTPS